MYRSVCQRHLTRYDGPNRHCQADDLSSFVPLLQVHEECEITQFGLGPSQPVHWPNLPLLDSTHHPSAVYRRRRSHC